MALSPPDLTVVQGDSCGNTQGLQSGSAWPMFIGSSDDNVYAIKPNGTLKWKFKTGDYVTCSPAIASDGTIYIGSWDNNLYAIGE